MTGSAEIDLAAALGELRSALADVSYAESLVLRRELFAGDPEEFATPGGHARGGGVSQDVVGRVRQRVSNLVAGDSAVASLVGQATERWNQGTDLSGLMLDFPVLEARLSAVNAPVWRVLAAFSPAFGGDGIGVAALVSVGVSSARRRSGIARIRRERGPTSVDLAVQVLTERECALHLDEILGILSEMGNRYSRKPLANRLDQDRRLRKFQAVYGLVEWPAERWPEGRRPRESTREPTRRG